MPSTFIALSLFVDSKKCRRCFCVAGESQHCTSLNETICEKLNALKSQRKHCQIRNKQLHPGASVKVVLFHRFISGVDTPNVR